VWVSKGWGSSFEDGISWKVGDGKDVLFWEDCWLGQDALKRVFPRLFSMCPIKDAKVAEIGSWSDGVWVWHLAWCRSLFEWEKPLVDQLYQALLEVSLVLGEADKWVWKAGGLQTFSVSSAYSLLRRDCEVVFSPTYCKLWNCKVVPSTLVTA